MKQTRYLALLRGINVGGKNRMKMPLLKACFEKIGFGPVSTYIQSGNVLFTAERAHLKHLTDKIEKALSRQFVYTASVVLVSAQELKTIVQNAPPAFGKLPTEYRYDVIFLKDPLTTIQAMKDVQIKEGVDRVYAGKNNVLYFSRLIKKAGQSRLSRIVQMPSYKNMTIRNWNTTTNLLTLIDSKT